MRLIMAAFSTVLLLTGHTPLPAAEIDIGGSSSFDNIPAQANQMEAGLRLPVTKNIAVLGRVQLVDARQEAFHGILPLSARTYSALAGMSASILGQRVLLEPLAGFDQVGRRALLRWDVQGGINVPVPGEPVLSKALIRMQTYRTGRFISPISSRNNIVLTGASAGLGTTLLGRFEVYGKYEIQQFEPQDPILDTTLLAPRPGGIPLDTLAENRITHFYAYSYTRVLSSPALSLGYAFSWSNSELNRWVATWQTIAVASPSPSRPGSNILLVREYAYYPYSTPLNARAHSLLVLLDFALPRSAALKSKMTFPFISSRQALFSPDTAALNTAQTYYREANTAPLVLESKLEKESGHFSFEFGYSLVCVPYREFSYFTTDSYAFHTVYGRVRLKLPGSPQ